MLAELKAPAKRVVCWKCGRLIFMAYDVRGEGVIELLCWHSSCKAQNAVNLLSLERYQNERS